jgi:hypothetical protein
VKNACAIQAGENFVCRELKKVSDENAANLSFDISQNTNGNDLSVKVTVIRETRAVNIAK